MKKAQERKKKTTEPMPEGGSGTAAPGHSEGAPNPGISEATPNTEGKQKRKHKPKAEPKAKAEAEAKAEYEAKLNRNFKASLFESLFSEEPARCVELYNAINGTDYPPDTPIDMAIIDGVLILGKKNDLAFIMCGRIVVIAEHQSTINKNMPLRFLLYCTRIYEKIVDSDALYMRKLVKVPYPEFIVLYNGEDKMDDVVTYKLSDAFESLPEGSGISGGPPLELKVTVYNVNDGRNPEIMKRSESLRGYAYLVARLRAHEKAGLARVEAARQAVNDCIEAGLLAKYLRSKASEVINMLTQEWNWKDAERVWRAEAMEDGISIGRGEGISIGRGEGVEAGKIMIARQMMADNLSDEQIAKYTLLPIETVRALRYS